MIEMGGDWTDGQNDAIVADYFAMLADDIAGRPYSKAGHNRMVSHADGDGAGYDIQSFDIDGSSRLIEVKTTNGWERTPFHITRNELAVAEARRRDWRLVRLWNFAREPRAFELRPPLDAHVTLMATSYEASFI